MGNMMSFKYSARVLLLLTFSALAGSGGSAVREQNGLWSSVSYDAYESRNSPAARITPGNVGRLGPVWVADLSDISQRAMEATPIVVDGTMFISASYGVVVAFNAATGKELSRFDPGVAKDYIRKGC